MGKNKLAKFDDMAGYPHVFQYPFARPTRKRVWYERTVAWNVFSRTITLLFWNWDAEKGNYTVGWESFSQIRILFGVDIKGARMWTGAKRIAGNRDEERGFPTYEYRIDFLFLRSGRSSRDLDHISRPPNEKVKQASDWNPSYEMYREILSGDGIIHLKRTVTSCIPIRARW